MYSCTKYNVHVSGVEGGGGTWSARVFVPSGFHMHDRVKGFLTEYCTLVP